MAEKDAESSKKKKKDFFLPRVTLRAKNGKLRSFKLGKKLGSGGYGDIFSGADEADNHQVAVKLGTEHGMKMLQREAKAYELFDPAYAGIPTIEAHGPFAGCYVMVLGQSLQDILTQYHYTPCAVANIAIQALNHLEYIHSKHYIHGDIKPSNLLVGLGRHCNDVYIIDFGLAKEFRTGKAKKHVPFSTKNGFHGTPRYASINAHQGIAPSRRDDLESLGYVLVYLLRGSLPWQSAPAGPPETRKERRQRITNTKITLPLEELCRGQPAEFVTYLRIVRSLKFTEQPPYETLRRLFVDFRTKQCGAVTDWFSTLVKRERPLGDDTDDQRLPPAPSQPSPAAAPAAPALAAAPAAAARDDGRPLKKAKADEPEVIVISDDEPANTAIPVTSGVAIVAIPPKPMLATAADGAAAPLSGLALDAAIPAAAAVTPVAAPAGDVVPAAAAAAGTAVGQRKRKGKA